MSGKIRKAINFDLDTNALKQVYCKTNNPFERLKAYGEIKKFMKENGFIHKQWSGYISKEPLSKTQVDKLIKKMVNEFDWFAKCVNKFDVTNIGNQYDMTKRIWEYSSKIEKANNKEKNAPKLKSQLKTSDKVTKNLTTPEQEQNKAMSNGVRDMSHTPLTDKEISEVKEAIRRIGADESLFVFNDEKHLSRSTCYNVLEDKIYVTRNIFPDLKYGSTHPRDLMSIAAVLAHEYYGHRAFRGEYLSDYEKGTETTPAWKDECRASITAAKTAPNLTQKERSDLILDAIYRAKEAGQFIELDNFMKGVIYGYSDEEKNISKGFDKITFVSESSYRRDEEKRICNNDMSKMQNDSRSDYERE